MELIRKPLPEEERLIKYLIEKAAINVSSKWNDNISVCPMNDGQMGSLLLFPNGRTDIKRSLGKQVSEYQFTDVDGVEVIASLNLDTFGELFELDMWKTNFSPLVKFPEVFP